MPKRTYNVNNRARPKAVLMKEETQFHEIKFQAGKSLYILNMNSMDIKNPYQNQALPLKYYFLTYQIIFTEEQAKMEAWAEI